MTKRVFSNEALTHQWAHDIIDCQYLSGGTTIGKGSSTHYTRSYQNTTAPDTTVLPFYSYRTIIAYRISTADAQVLHLSPLFLLDTTSHSSTTSKHQYNLKSAAYGPAVYCLPRPDPFDMHTCRDAVMVQVETHMRSAAMARTKREYYIAQAVTLIDSFNEALDSLHARGVPVAHVPRIDTACVGNADLPAIHAMAKAEQARHRAREDERLERVRGIHNAYCEAWRKHDGAPDGAYLVHELPTPLRISADGAMVETARHAEIPVNHAKRLWPVLLAVRHTVGDEQAQIRGSVVGMKLGVFTLNEVTDQADIVVGCHRLLYEEMAGIAGQLGLVVDMEQITQGETA